MTPAKRRALGATREQVGTWWNPATPDDVRAEQKRVDAARAGVATPLATSPPKGDPTEIDNAVRGWNSTNALAVSYVAEEPSVFWWSRDDQLKQGQMLEAQIESYRQTFSRLSVPVPSAPAPAPTQPGIMNTPLFGDLADTLKWAVIGFLAYELLGKSK